jgi:hypothetical protein
MMIFEHAYLGFYLERLVEGIKLDLVIFLEDAMVHPVLTVAWILFDKVSDNSYLLIRVCSVCMFSKD